LYIERVQVEEGFLDGLDLELMPGLNVVIGARGTGKTSLIELIRFCLGVPGHTAESSQKAAEHAMAILEGGRVTVTLRLPDRRINISRSADQPLPKRSNDFVSPSIFSQTEIETVGLSAPGRLRLLDTFIKNRGQLAQSESAAISEIKSATTELSSYRQQKADLEEKLSHLDEIEQQLKEAEEKEQSLTKVSTAMKTRKIEADRFSSQSSKFAVQLSYLERLAETVEEWRDHISQILDHGSEMEEAAEEVDPAAVAREHFEKAKKAIQTARRELLAAGKLLAELSGNANREKLKVDDKARQIRKELEVQQQGAGAIVRQAAALREKKAQLAALANNAKNLTTKIRSLEKIRESALDRLDQIREERFKSRQECAQSLNAELGPRIHVEVERSGQLDQYSAVIADCLKGSGLHYNELASSLSAAMSPREIVEAVDQTNHELISEALGISRERAVRLISAFKSCNLGEVLTVTVEDETRFSLLDGSESKDIADLSTGQRCTVILPLVLEQKNRVIIVDQPEDHIDNAFIAETVVKAIKERSPGSQILFSTHNPNIPVLGEADRVIHMSSDGKRGFVLEASSLDDSAIVAAITSVMEGGREAFRLRAKFYGGH
jgi:ABC-type lipoprotein export system ATPase subunit